MLRSMSRRKYIAVGAADAAAVAAVGVCSQLGVFSPAPTTTVKTKKITVGIMENWRIIMPLMPVTEKMFTASTGITVSWDQVPNYALMPVTEKMFTASTGITASRDPVPKYVKKFILELINDTGIYDVLHMPSEYFNRIQGKLLDLEPFIKRDFGSVQAFKDKFYPNTINAMYEDSEVDFKPIGPILGVPFYAGTLSVVYRKECFENQTQKDNFKKQFGYDLPLPVTTYQQLRDVAEFFTRGPGDPLSRWGYVNSWSSGHAIWHDFMGAGFDLIDPDVTPYRFATGSKRDEILEILRFHAKLNNDTVNGNRICPPGTSINGDNEVVGFISRKEVPMGTCWWGDWQNVVNSADYQSPSKAGPLAQSALPYRHPERTIMGVQTGTFLSCHGWYIPATISKERQEAAWEFIKWAALNHDAAWITIEGCGMFHPVKAFTEEAVSKGKTGAGLRDAVMIAKKAIISKKYLEIRNQALTKECALMVEGKQTPEVTLDKMESTTNSILIAAGY